MRSLFALSFALALPFLLAHEAAGQTNTGSVTVSGRVSPAVFLNAAPGADSLQVTYTQQDARTLRLKISTDGSASSRVSIPLQLRSNAASELSISATPGGAELLSIGVTGARATGSFVAPEALAAATGEPHTIHSTPTRTLLKLPRISLAGTHDSPSNALEVTLLLEVQPGDLELTLTASHASH